MAAHLQLPVAVLRLFFLARTAAITQPGRLAPGAAEVAEEKPATERQLAKAQETLTEGPAQPWYTSVTGWINVMDGAISVLALLTILITTVSGHELIQQSPEVAKWLIVARSLTGLAVSVVTIIRRWAGNLPLTKVF